MLLNLLIIVSVIPTIQAENVSLWVDHVVDVSSEYRSSWLARDIIGKSDIAVDARGECSSSCWTPTTFADNHHITVQTGSQLKVRSISVYKTASTDEPYTGEVIKQVKLQMENNSWDIVKTLAIRQMQFSNILRIDLENISYCADTVRLDIDFSSYFLFGAFFDAVKVSGDTDSCTKGQFWGKEYQWLTVDMTWNEAYRTCRDMGQELLMIETAVELTAIENLVNSAITQGVSSWIGVYRETEGLLRYMNGIRFTDVAVWSINDNGGDCAFMSWNNTSFHMDNCYGIHELICEKPKECTKQTWDQARFNGTSDIVNNTDSRLECELHCAQRYGSSQVCYGYSFNTKASICHLYVSDNPLKYLETWNIIYDSGYILTSVQCYTGIMIEQWVSKVPGSSGNIPFTSAQVVGPPDFYPQVGYDTNTWRINGAGKDIVLVYSQAVKIASIGVYETNDPGSLDVIECKHPNGSWITIWTLGRPTQQESGSRVVTAHPQSEISFCTSELHVNFTVRAETSWRAQIDAVQIYGETCLDVNNAYDIKLDIPDFLNKTSNNSETLITVTGLDTETSSNALVVTEPSTERITYRDSSTPGLTTETSSGISSVSETSSEDVTYWNSGISGLSTVTYTGVSTESETSSEGTTHKNSGTPEENPEACSSFPWWASMIAGYVSGVLTVIGTVLVVSKLKSSKVGPLQITVHSNAPRNVQCRQQPKRKLSTHNKTEGSDSEDSDEGSDVRSIKMYSDSDSEERRFRVHLMKVYKNGFRTAPISQNDRQRIANHAEELKSVEPITTVKEKHHISKI